MSEEEVDLESFKAIIHTIEREYKIVITVGKIENSRIDKNIKVFKN